MRNGTSEDKKTDDPDKLRRLKKRKNSMQAAYQNCSQLHNMIFRNLRYKDLQAVVDQCPLKHASKELIVVLFHKMYKYARSRKFSLRTIQNT